MQSAYRFITALFAILAPVRILAAENGLKGYAFLEGIKRIIGADPNLPPGEVEYKPFVGSFTNLSPADDLSNVSYCLTDQACGQPDAYSRNDVPLDLLGCNHFCYIDATTGKYVQSAEYSTDAPPTQYLNCGWETCG